MSPSPLPLLLEELGHGHKGPRIDPGATFDFDGDGRIDSDEREDFLVRGYTEEVHANLGWAVCRVAAGTEITAELVAEHAERARATGGGVVTFGEGSYPWRRAAADAWARLWPFEGARGLWAAYHINSVARGAPDRAELWHHRKSSQGLRAARALEGPMAQLLPVGEVRVEPAWDDRDRGEDAYRVRANWVVGWTLRGLPGNVCGVLVEPGFLPTPAHRLMWEVDGLATIGRAIATGVRSYLGG